MKVVLTLLFLFVGVIILISIKDVNNTYVYQEYINVEDENTYQNFILDVENLYVTTRNISKYLLEDTKVLGLLPVLNTLYINNFFNDWYYFKPVTYKQNINSFEKYIKDNLKNHNFISDGNTVILEGVRLNKIIINTSNKNIKQLKKMFPQISIS